MMGGKSEKERKNKPKTTNLQSLLQIKEEKGKRKKQFPDFLESGLNTSA